MKARAVPRDALLSIIDRTGRVELHADGDGEHQRTGQHQNERAERVVFDVLQQVSPATQRGVGEVDDGQAGDLGKRVMQQVETIDVGHEADMQGMVLQRAQ